MKHRTSIFLIPAGFALSLALATSGCATRGYVRSQVADLRRESSSRDAELRERVESLDRLAESASTEAKDAADTAEMARRIGLGEAEYAEVARFRVYFPFDSAELADSSRTTLDTVADLLSNHVNYQAAILGLTDPTGSSDYNERLGMRRAESIRRYLAVGNPDQLRRFQSVSFGENPPPAAELPASTDEWRMRQGLILVVERTASGHKIAERR